jgi:hypothetical protein
MVGVHHELNDAKLRLGIRTKMNGDDKPAAAPAETTTLRQAI